MQFDAQRVQTKDTCEGMVTGVKYLLKALEMQRRKDKCRSSFTRNSRRRPGQPMAEWVNVFEKAVLDMKAEGVNVELESVGWHLFEKNNLTLERQERVLGAAEGEYEFAAIVDQPIV